MRTRGKGVKKSKYVADIIPASSKRCQTARMMHSRPKHKEGSSKTNSLLATPRDDYFRFVLMVSDKHEDE